MSIINTGAQILGQRQIMPMSPRKLLNRNNFIDFSNPAKTEEMLAREDLKVETHNTLAYVLNLMNKANKENLKNARKA